jgi:predicted nucleic acid-binding protein
MGDPEDVPFLALALAKGAPIWTDDRHFRRQNVVRVISTAELVAQSHANGCG